MRLYFIRHAQSENNASEERIGSDLGRSEDPALTPVGVQQTLILAEFLAQNGHRATQPANRFAHKWSIQITHLYSSLMERSLTTGAAISKTTGIPLHGWPDLHETGGIYLKDEASGKRVGLPGKTPIFLQTCYPGLILPPDVNPNGWWNRPYETYEEIMPRAHRVIQRLRDEHAGTDNHVAVVSHGGFFNFFICALLGIEESGDIWFLMNNAAITCIDFQSDRVRVVYTNRFDFLPPELVT